MHSSLRISALLAVVIASSAGAQLPGAPVLQNVWATPGLVGALDFGGSADGSVFAGAVGWTPGSGRFQVSAGIGSRTLTGHGSKAAYGARVAIPLGGASSTFGFAAFAGVGGSGAGKATVPDTTVRGVTLVDSTAWATQVPLGVAVGWRHAFGATHGVSVYATPSYVLYSGGTKTGGLFRTAIGADVGITNAIGATLGIDFGGTHPRGFGGPSATQYGLGLSYAFGRR